MRKGAKQKTKEQRIDPRFVPMVAAFAKVRDVCGGKLMSSYGLKVNGKIYPFYAAALGEMELRRGEDGKAHEHFQTALALARNPMERRFLENRLSACQGQTVE